MNSSGNLALGKKQNENVELIENIQISAEVSIFGNDKKQHHAKIRNYDLKLDDGSHTALGELTIFYHY